LIGNTFDTERSRLVTDSMILDGIIESLIQLLIYEIIDIKSQVLSLFALIMEVVNSAIIQTEFVNKSFLLVLLGQFESCLDKELKV
jgi:hypothetical protein